MKGQLLLLAILAFSFLFNACSKSHSRDALVKKSAEVYIKEHMNDPSSYEFSDLKLIDSTLYKDNITFRRDSFRDEIKFDSDRLERQLSYRREIPSMYDPKDVKSLRASIEQNKKILAEIKLIEQGLGNKVNQVAAYKYLFSCRGKNAFGALILNTYVLQVTPYPECKVLGMSTDEDKVILNPNEFPGYHEMIVRYIHWLLVSWSYSCLIDCNHLVYSHSLWINAIARP